MILRIYLPVTFLTAVIVRQGAAEAAFAAMISADRGVVRVRFRACVGEISRALGGPCTSKCTERHTGSVLPPDGQGDPSYRTAVPKMNVVRGTAVFRFTSSKMHMLFTHSLLV